MIDKDYIIVGAGPAGLQLAYFLETRGYDYVVVERGKAAGEFFRTFPRHRKLISINKVYTGDVSRHVAMRWDWNSLLSDDLGLLFADTTKEYFPQADRLVEYLNAYARRYELRVDYGVDIVQVAKEGERFVIRCAQGECYRAKVLVVATGFAREHHPSFEGAEYVTPYGKVSTDKDDFKNKRVMILGKGNSAFETADHLVEHAACIHVVSPEPVRLAWKSHYVGHLRAVNNNLLDTYQLKGQNSVQNADIARIQKTTTGYAVTVAYTKTKGETRVIEVDHVIGCVGFRMDSGIFAESAKPRTLRDGKYPDIGPDFQSRNVPGLYFAGTLTHARDFGKANSGFIHGFRYNVANLFRIFERDREGKPWPSSLHARTSDFATLLVQDLLKTSALFHQPEVIANVLDLSGQDPTYYREVPRDYAASAIVPKQGAYLAVTLEFGKHEIADPFDANDAPNESTIFLHPVFRYVRQDELVAELHLRQDLENQWDTRENLRSLTTWLLQTCRLGRAELVASRESELFESGQLGRAGSVPGSEWLDAVRPTLARMSAQTAWISGSVVEGLGNPSSDLDVFVAVAGDPRPASDWLQREVLSNVYHSNARRIEYGIWTLEDIRQLAAKLARAPVRQGTKAILEYLTEAEVEFIHRTRVGHPVLHAESFAELRREFDFEVFQTYLVENQKINVDDGFDDAVGMLAVGEVRSAALRARYTAESAMSLLLFACGVTNHKEKHRQRFLEMLRRERPAVGRLYRRFWPLIAQVPDSDSDLRLYVQRALQFSEEVVDVVECS